MAINKKLIHFNKKSDFDTKSKATSSSDTTSDIPYTSIVFIKDTQEIWTHGQLYGPSSTEYNELKAKVESIENAISSNIPNTQLYIDNNIDLTKDFAVLMDDGTVYIEKNKDWSTVTITGYISGYTLPCVNITWYNSDLKSKLWYSEYRPKFTKVLSLGDISTVDNRIFLYGAFRNEENTPFPDYLNTTGNPYKIYCDVVLNGKQTLPSNYVIDDCRRLTDCVIPTKLKFKPSFACGMIPNFHHSRFEDAGFSFLADETDKFYEIDMSDLGAIASFDTCYLANPLTIKITPPTTFNNEYTNPIFLNVCFGNYPYVGMANNYKTAWTNWGKLTSNMVDAHRLFKGSYTEDYSSDKIIDLTVFDFGKTTIFADAFNDCKFSKIKVSLPAITDGLTCFCNSMLKYLEITNLGSLSTRRSNFLYNLPELETLIVNLTNVTDTTGMFGSIFPKATDVRIAGIKVNTDLRNFPNMSMTSAKYIIDNLATVTGKTLTLYKKVVDKLPEEWTTIATNKGWTIASATSSDLDIAYSGAPMQREEYSASTPNMELYMKKEDFNAVSVPSGLGIIASPSSVKITKSVLEGGDDGSLVEVEENPLVIPSATSTHAGVMSAEDKAKLDSIRNGSESPSIADDNIGIVTVILNTDTIPSDGLDITENFKKVVKEITVERVSSGGESLSTITFDTNKSVYLNIWNLSSYGIRDFSNGYLYQINDWPYSGKLYLTDMSYCGVANGFDSNNIEALAEYTLEIDYGYTTPNSSYTVKLKKLRDRTQTYQEYLKLITKGLPEATSTTDGLMSATDKVCVNRLKEAGSIASTVSLIQGINGIKLNTTHIIKDINGLPYDTENVTTDLQNAANDRAGLMSKEDKVKLDSNLPVNWDVSLNTSSPMTFTPIKDNMEENVKVGDSISHSYFGTALITKVYTINSMKFIEGSVVFNNIKYVFTGNFFNNQFNIEKELNTDNLIINNVPEATTSSKGLMSADDKTKLNGISKSITLDWGDTIPPGIANFDEYGIIDYITTYGLGNVHIKYKDVMYTIDTKVNNAGGYCSSPVTTVYFDERDGYVPICSALYICPANDGYTVYTIETQKDHRTYNITYSDNSEQYIGSLTGIKIGDTIICSGDDNFKILVDNISGDIISGKSIQNDSSQSQSYIEINTSTKTVKYNQVFYTFASSSQSGYITANQYNAIEKLYKPNLITADAVTLTGDDISTTGTSDTSFFDYLLSISQQSGGIFYPTVLVIPVNSGSSTLQYYCTVTSSLVKGQTVELYSTLLGSGSVLYNVKAVVGQNGISIALTPAL